MTGPEPARANMPDPGEDAARSICYLKRYHANANRPHRTVVARYRSCGALSEQHEAMRSTKRAVQGCSAIECRTGRLRYTARRTNILVASHSNLADATTRAPAVQRLLLSPCDKLLTVRIRLDSEGCTAL